MPPSARSCRSPAEPAQDKHRAHCQHAEEHPCPAEAPQYSSGGTAPKTAEPGRRGDRQPRMRGADPPVPRQEAAARNGGAGRGFHPGPNSVILPAASLGRHATVGHVSLVMRGESVPDRTRWIGTRSVHGRRTWPSDGRRRLPPRPRRLRLLRAPLRPVPHLHRPREPPVREGHPARDRVTPTDQVTLDLRGLAVDKLVVRCAACTTPIGAAGS